MAYKVIQVSGLMQKVPKGTMTKNIFVPEYAPTIFTNSAPLGRAGHRVAMSVCVSVFCAIAKHPLPEVV